MEKSGKIYSCLLLWYDNFHKYDDEHKTINIE